MIQQTLTKETRTEIVKLSETKIKAEAERMVSRWIDEIAEMTGDTMSRMQTLDPEESLQIEATHARIWNTYIEETVAALIKEKGHEVKTQRTSSK